MAKLTSTQAATLPEESTTGAAPAYESIETMRRKHATPDAVFNGTCIAMHWRAGKMVTDGEYTAAIAAFGSAPMGGREQGKGGKASVT